jgi:predicted nucleic acid-binding protein
VVARVVLDAGALLAFGRADPYVRSLIRTAQQQNNEIVIPAVAVAQVLRGGYRDTIIHRLINTVYVSYIGLRLARVAGELLGESGTTDAVDALIVAEALRAGPTVILTSDPEDMKHLIGDRPQLRIVTV